MGLLTKELLAKAARQDLNRQRQITAQKEVLDRLLRARASDTSDNVLIYELCEERRVLNEEKLLLEARFQRLTDLLESESEYRVDELREAMKAALDG